MVNGGIVSGDATSLQGYLSSYKSEMSSLNGSWKGPSYDSITSQADSFVSEYNGIVSQMNSFAVACNEYKNYEYLMEKLNQCEANKAAAPEEEKGSYDSVIFEVRDSLMRCKAKIRNYLSEASSLKLTATSISSSASSGSAGSSSSSGSKTDSSSGGKSSSSNQGIIDSIKDEVGNTIGDYSGFNDGEWCADFVSHTLQKNGYDVKWSSIAGHEDNNTIFRVLEDSGATIHLDQAAQYNGEEYDSDYTPQAGDVVLFDFADGSTPDGTTDHVGFVVKDNGDGTITTIEGNTTANDGSSGSCVEMKVRDRSEVYGYATPKK